MRVKSKTVVIEMLEHDGAYCGDPIPDSIWSYTNMTDGEEMFAVFYPGTYCDIFDSPFVFSPKALFLNGHMSEHGRWFLHMEGRKVYESRAESQAV